MKNIKFRGIPQQKDEFCGKIPRLHSAAKIQIPRLAAKFRGPRKTVGLLTIDLCAWITGQ